MTLSGLAADLIVLVHAAYVAFVVVGLLSVWLGLVLRWRWVRNFWFRLIHAFLIVVVVMETVFGVPCPLTTWEDALRQQAGQPVEQATFVGRLMHWLLFYEAPEWVFTAVYFAFGAIVLVTLVLVPPRWPGRHKAPA